METRSKYLFKNLGILTISNFASKILVFLLVPLYTSILSTTEYGTYDLVVSTASLLFPLLTLNIVDAVMRFSMDKVYSKEAIATVGMKYILISIAIVGWLLFVFDTFDLSAALDGLKKNIFFYFLSYVLNQYFIQLAKGLEKVKDMGIAGVIGTLVMIGANILFLPVLGMGLHGFFIANTLAQAVPVVYYFFRLRFWHLVSRARFDRRLEREMLIYSVPLICNALGWWVNSAADKYVVSFLCGIAANGLLSVAYKIPGIINTLQSIFTQAWQISAVKVYRDRDAEDFYEKAFSYLNAILSMICSLLIVLSKPLAHILYINEFYAAWQYVPFLLISSVINASSGFIGSILSAKKDSKSMALSTLYGSVLNIVLDLVLISSIGIQGAAIATMASSVLICFLRRHSVQKELRAEKYGIVVFIWILLVIQAVAAIYFPWYVEICIMIVLQFFNLRCCKISRL